MARSSGFGTVPTWRRVCDVVAIRGKADVTLKRRHFRESDPFRKSRLFDEQSLSCAFVAHNVDDYPVVIPHEEPANSPWLVN
jgi:hypothetical protein